MKNWQAPLTKPENGQKDEDSNSLFCQIHHDMIIPSDLTAYVGPPSSFDGRVVRPVTLGGSDSRVVCHLRSDLAMAQSEQANKLATWRSSERGSGFLHGKSSLQGCVRCVHSQPAPDVRPDGTKHDGKRSLNPVQYGVLFWVFFKAFAKWRFQSGSIVNSLTKWLPPLPSRLMREG